MIDHLIYRAPDLVNAVAEVEERLGVRAQASGQHTGLGTHNALLTLGRQTYLEIIAPDPRQPQPPAPRPFGPDGAVSLSADNRDKHLLCQSGIGWLSFIGGCSSRAGRRWTTAAGRTRRSGMRRPGHAAR